MDDDVWPRTPRTPVEIEAAVAAVGAAATAAVRDDRMPVIYLGHGAPPLVDDALWVARLAAWGASLPRPRAILVISAHWEAAPLAIGAAAAGVPLVYDFFGFPERYYRVTYAAPPAPALARRVRELLSPIEEVVERPGRGLDHGAYVPLLVMYPAADVPVLQISMPSLDPARLLAVGARLRPLREERVLVVAAGFSRTVCRTCATSGRMRRRRRGHLSSTAGRRRRWPGTTSTRWRPSRALPRLATRTPRASTWRRSSSPSAPPAAHTAPWRRSPATTWGSRSARSRSRSGPPPEASSACSSGSRRPPLTTAGSLSGRCPLLLAARPSR